MIHRVLILTSVHQLLFSEGDIGEEIWNAYGCIWSVVWMIVLLN